MLTGRSLWFRYGARRPWAVQDVSLTIEPGEVVGLSGPSGSGKTTIGRLLAGYVVPQRGRVEGDGPRRRGPRPVQLVPQHAEQAMNPHWRIGAVLAESGAELGAIDPELVAPHWLDRFPHELSGGELQRVSLARALLTRPRFLVADEITASLDAVTQARIWRLLLDSARTERIGVLAVSHDRPLLAAISDRVIDLDPA